MKTIDITPSHDEATRILAYILSNNADCYMVLKDYWAPTAEEGEKVREAWSYYEPILEAVRAVGKELTPTEKRKWARACLAKAGI